MHPAKDRWALRSALLLAAMMFAGCRSESQLRIPGLQDAGIPDEELLIRFTRSGGFSSIYETLSVGRDGEMVRVDIGKEPRRARATEEQLTRLKEMLAGEEFRSLQTEYDPNRFDSILYQIQTRGKEISTNGLASPPLRALIRECETLLLSIR